MITETKRLTATPNCHETALRDESPGVVTVWVEPDRLWFKSNYPTRNPEAANPEGWGRMTQAEWERMRDCIDLYFEAVVA